MPKRQGLGRASAACTFCRQKKLKCDAVKPTCGNCIAKGIDCQQGPAQHKPRPTNQRIARLESENTFLRQRLQTGDTPVAGHGAPGLSVEQAFSPQQPCSVDSPISGPERSIRTLADIGARGSHIPTEVPDNDPRSNISLYHGPTSTAYYETSSPQQRNGQVNDFYATEEWSRHLLFAQTAKQRQLEPLNLRAGRLDFDGVDPGIGMELLSIYWSRQIYTAQIIHRPVFMRDMACDGPYFSKLLLNSIFFVVSKHCLRPEVRTDPDDINTAGLMYRQRFVELLREKFDKSEITTIQALLIMSNALFSRCDERSLSWLYAGNAFNMIIDLGLHVLPSTNNTSAEQLEIRKRVVWGAYSIDKIQCLLQGRPSLLRKRDFNTPLKFLDEYDELEQFDSISYKTNHQQLGIPALNVTLLTKLCELSVIIEHLMCEVYSESTPNARLSQKMNVCERIKSDLSQWRKTLPPQMDYIAHSGDPGFVLPQALCLLALCNTLVILSERPFITDSHSSSIVAHESITASTAAANQTVQILRDYAQHYSIGSAPYVLSYATYVSATIHARIVAHKGKGSVSFQSLIFCLNTLEEQKDIYAAAIKARQNLDRLMDHLGVSIAVNGSMSGNTTGDSAQVQTVQYESVATPDKTQAVGTTFAGNGFPQTDWELSNLDLDAILQGFLLDRDGQFPLYPLGTL
ncbi:uncharacterized protein ASPGLDRAFT_174246 [Aspergillus glaucus CBS 516.65]|uniref:Zn(2)-C6 fungal-type domain-containing protein n=1 Tax=Aspergillus glaucus CBS 516.65 TaxID=1160497 RepID=A0A1L9VFQ8_ASPGL|nr:hypothetical protein ASPGLDRAFT_174246 [Aspergillus glaucus CBS 516.65]OJJ82739.1 hypothetical protein ASPGLDRAFT_174246 [Aspergillus glaucus CBS 516.65]